MWTRQGGIVLTTKCFACFSHVAFIAHVADRGVLSRVLAFAAHTQLSMNPPASEPTEHLMSHSRDIGTLNHVSEWG